MNNIYYIIFFFILGTVMGSFYHVVGTRLSIDESIFKPKRSYCPMCGHTLKWYELIPLVSYLIQGGKCRKCKKQIPFQYFFVELFSGILYAVSFYSFGFTLDLVVALLLVSLFLIVVVSDFNYLMIPDEVTLTIGFLIVIVNFFRLGIQGGLYSLGSGALLFGIMFLLMELGNFLFKTESLGGGDIKLMFVVGLVLHPLLGVLVIFLSSFIALPVSLILYLYNKEKIIPFGPFILVSMLFLFFLKVDLNMVLSFLQML